MANKTITINGKLYDAVTGLPVKAPAARPVTVKKAKKITVSENKTRKIAVQEGKKPAGAKATTKPTRTVAVTKKISPRKPAKSRTLNRIAVKKPATKAAKSTPKPITKPGPRVTTKPVAPRIATAPSPVVPTMSQRDIRPKRTAPTKGLAAEKPKSHEETGKSTKKVRLRVTLITLSILVVLIGGGAASYLFIPQVSFWVASTRADVRAKLPVYTPNNYRVDGTAQSSPGQVTVNFKSGGGATYSLTEQNSNWDSKGVLENKVKPNSRDYQTLTQKGLTIYRYNDKAIWVNGGVLYTITDGKNLSNDEILQIVDSM